MLPRIILTPIDDPAVCAALLDPLAHINAASWSQDPHIERLRPFTVVVSNSLAKSITAMTVRWIYRDVVGTELSSSVRSDSYLHNKSAVLTPKGQLLATPVGFCAFEPLGSICITGAIRTPARLNELERASDVRICVDVIIFEDGQVIGPDESQTIEALEARKIAASDLAKRVRDTIDKGEDVQSLLSGLSNDAQLWIRRLALSLAGEWAQDPTLSRELAQLDNPPSLPKFYRKSS